MIEAAALKEKIVAEMKNAMRHQQKERLATIRLILAALKQREVDERITLTDEHVLTILNKMVKQRRDSITQYTAGNRPDLAQKEAEEITIIQSFLPTPFSEAEIEQVLKDAMQEVGASSARDMGKVMGIVKVKLQGRADMTAVSNKVKSLLGS
jgi:uncharacterized protein